MVDLKDAFYVRMSPLFVFYEAIPNSSPEPVRKHRVEIITRTTYIHTCMW